MNDAPENIAQTVATVVQTIGAAVACLVLIGWAWALAAGSLLGFVLLFLLGMLFIAPIIAWGLPAVALAAGLIAQGFVAFIRWRRSRA